jgi:hypothetical protein
MRRDLAPPVPPVMAQQPAGWETEAEVTRLGTRVSRWARRERHLSVPLLMPGVMLTAAEIVHALHHPGGVLAATAVIATATWFGAPSRWDRAAEQWYARATAIGAGSWLTAAAYGGVHRPGALAMLGGCTAWGLAFWWHKRPRDKRARRRHARRVARWDEFWQSHAPAWGLTGSRVIDVEGAPEDPVESLLIQLSSGRQSPASLKNVLPLIESGLDGYVHAGKTKLEPVSHRPSQVWLVMQKEDPLGEEIEWDPSWMADDITQPVPLGVLEDGRLIERVLLSSSLILGATRTGKSNELSLMLATITRALNSRALVIAPKGGRAGRPWLPALEAFADDITEGRFLLEMGVAEIDARGKYAYNGNEQNTPTPECPALHIVIDEAFVVTSQIKGDTRCADAAAIIASQGAAVNVYIDFLSQYGGLAETVRTEQTRSNLPYRFSFRTEDPAHGVFALGDDARGKVDTTKLDEQGQFYFRHGRTMLMMARAPHMPHALCRALAVENAAHSQLHKRPLKLYCGAFPMLPDHDSPTWQEAYDMRWRRLPETFLADAPQAQQVHDPSPADDAEGASSKIISERRYPDEVTALMDRINAGAAEFDVTDDDIRAAAASRAARGAPPLDLAGATERKYRLFADACQAATRDEPASPKGLIEASGLSESWVHPELRRLIEAGALEQVGRGRYARIAGSDVWAAMEAIRGDGDRLAAEARELVGAGRS